MKRIRHHFAIVLAVLLAALSAGACVQPLEHDSPELMVSLYMPDLLATKADNGPVNPTANEHKVTTLQIWVFLPDGTRASYKAFDLASAETGLTNNAVTRFGLPLTPQMFSALSAENAKANVYALANADAAWSLGETTTQSELDAFVLENNMYGAATMTTAVPAAGLPMSGVLKNAPVTGGYPVLNISTLTLTRAVSKIRFVFIQQGLDSNPTETPLNEHCAIKSIVFNNSEIAEKENLFTENASAISGYTALTGSFTGNPLIANGDMACAEDPESLVYQAGETAQDYEARLDAAIGTKASQVGPVYIRETDKQIMGTITYVTEANGQDKTVSFSMAAGDALLRNHSWIVYAYFAEETRTLILNVTVLPWTRERYKIDYTTASVNVIRRYTATETSPSTFTKVQTEDGFFDVSFWHTVTIDGQARENEIKGDIIIATPVGGILHAVPVPGAPEGVSLIPEAITVTPETAGIYPRGLGNGEVEDCRIEFTVKCNKGTHTDAELEGQYIDLHFYVEYAGRQIDLGSESIDYYRFILKRNWDL